MVLCIMGLRIGPLLHRLAGWCLLPRVSLEVVTALSVVVVWDRLRVVVPFKMGH